MLIDVKHVLTNMAGTPLKFDMASADEITLATVCVEALLAASPDEPRTLTPAKNMERYSLAQRLYSASVPVDVSVEQVAELKQLIALRYPPLIAGQACVMLETGAVNP